MMGSVISVLLTVFVASAAVPGEKGKGPSQGLVSRDAGRVGGVILTTRQVIANSLIEDLLFRSDKAKNIGSRRPTDRVFIQETTAVLLEQAITKEAVDFPVAAVSDQELRAETARLAKATKAHRAWGSLKLGEEEVANILRGKLSAKKFLQFKVDAASLPITDDEAKAYFEKNKFKFENLSFDKFKVNIKSYLTKKHVDDRLREWFEVLKIKYSIRNHLAEGRAS